MADAPDMPLEETLRALAGTPARESSTIALLAWAAGRWSLMEDKQRDADRLLRQALEAAPELRPPMRLLAMIQERKRDVRGLIQFIDQEIRATRHPREAAALYRERGLVVESQFGDLEAATQCFHAAVQASAQDLPSLRAVERVSLSNGDIAGLESNLESQLTASSDAAASVPILHELGLLQRVVHQSTTARQTLALVNAYREEVGAKCKRLRRDLLLCCHPDHHHRYETAEEACTATTQAIERVFERVFEEFPSQ